MTAYTDVISLNRAKLYLKIDTLQTETDQEITSMINSALSFIEKRTGHIFKTKTKTFYSCALVESVIVYEYPIIDAPARTQVRQLNSIVPTIGGSVTLAIGYASLDDIPNELIDAALQLLKVWFYESETQVNSTLIPKSVMEAIDVNRRFV